MAKTIFEEMGGTYVRQGDYNWCGIKKVDSLFSRIS